MRRRFFLIVFGFLLAAILVVSTLQLFFIENEHTHQMDQRLETIASTLIASGLSLSLIENLESTDDLTHDLLGEERVDQIINVYSLEGHVLAQNYTGVELPLQFNKTVQRQTYDVKGRTVRVLNIQKGDLVVQVGMVQDPNVFRWNIVNQRFAVFVLSILILLFVTAYFSSGVLFNPLRNLTRELQSMSSRLDRKLGQPLSGFVIGPELSRLSRGGKATKDEFELLCNEIELFLKKLEDYTKSFNAQTAILTHELKTPLTILRNYLEELKQASEMGRVKSLNQAALGEIDRMTALINDYLQWSVLTSNPGQPEEIYAVKLSEVLQKMATGLNAIHNNRIKIEGVTDTLIFAMPSHVDQLLSNLLGNALNYSPITESVCCRMDTHSLFIEDRGAGIPKDVLAHMGSPFNRGETKNYSHKSSGLGLAWVSSLCEKYHWKLAIDSSGTGTKITITFA